MNFDSTMDSVRPLLAIKFDFHHKTYKYVQGSTGILFCTSTNNAICFVLMVQKMSVSKTRADGEWNGFHIWKLHYQTTMCVSRTNEPYTLTEERFIWRLDLLGRLLMAMACPGSLFKQQQQPNIVAALPNRVPNNKHHGGEEHQHEQIEWRAA